MLLVVKVFRCQVSGVRYQVSGVRCQVSGVDICFFYFVLTAPKGEVINLRVQKAL